MTSKGKQMRKFSTFKEDAQKIVIKKPWGVEIKSYKAGDPIPAGVKFKIFNATDTDKIEAYADSLDESADYQKKRFKEPAYMYEEWGNANKPEAESKKQYLKYVDEFEKDIKKYIDWMRKDIKGGNLINLPEVCISLSTALVNALTRYNNAVKTKTLNESTIDVMSIPVGGKFKDKIGGKEHTFYVVKHGDDDVVHAKEVNGSMRMMYDTYSNTKVEKVEEGRIAKGYENLDADEKARHLLSHPSSKYMNDLKSENITERAIRKAVKEMLGKPDKRDPQFIIDVNEDCIKESAYYIKSPSGFYVMKIDNSYDLTDDKEKALKYTIGNDAAKELFYIHKYSPDSRFKKLMVVQEEGEAPAATTTTAEVANPELPLKLKEDLESDKAEALADYKKAKAEYLANKSDENWKKFSNAKSKCMQLGCRI